MDNNQEKQHSPVIIQPSVITQVDKVDLKDMEYDTLVQMGIEVSEVKVYSQWVLGKLGDAVATKYGDLKKYADEIRQKHSVIEQYVKVYRKFTEEDPNFTPEKYSGSIPWGVLQIAASKSDNPQALLDDLADKGMEGTIEATVRGIHELNDPDGDKVPVKPRIRLRWDTEVKKYKIDLNPDDLDIIDWSDVKDQLRDYLESLT